MVTDGEHFVMYRNIESLCHVAGTNSVLWLNYTLKSNKLTHRKRDKICGGVELGKGS